MNYYQQLEVTPGASAVEIKEAYRRLAFEYHPDRNTDDPQSAEKMKAINEAYAVLSSPEKRRQYDGLYQRFGDGASQQFRASFSEQDIFKGSDIQHIFEEMARSFGLRGFDDIFKDFYGQGYHSFEFRQPGVFGKGFIFNSHPGVKTGASKNAGLLGSFAHSMLNKVMGAYLPLRGSDIRDMITLQPELARLGGPFAYYHRGLDKKLVVQIPAGVRDGQFIRLNGMGKPGSHGAPAGDLLLKVRIKRPLIQKLKSLIGAADPSIQK
jgi:DnaJ-class molecular chaperone